jgi:hypothetical protein
MIQFVNPVSGSRFNRIPGSKSVKITPNYGTPIVSPYRGVVTEVQNSGVTITHNINNVLYHSHFKGIHRPQVGVNVPLRQGESFAYGDDNDIEYSILDDNGKKLDVMMFINGFDNNSNTRTTTNDPDKDKNKDKNKNKNKKPIELSDKPPLHDFFTDILLSPLNLIHKPLKKGLDKLKGIKDDDEDENLNEEINRIKKLLK